MFKTLLHKHLGLPYRLYVRYDSKKGKDTIVFLHGLAASGDVWREAYERLRANHRVIVLDLLGFGASPKPDFLEYHVNDHARAVERTLRWMKIRRYYVVGHSMGAIVALRLAIDSPNSVEGLLCASMPAYDVGGDRQKVLTRYRTNAFILLYTKIINSPDQTLAAVKVLSERFKSKIGMSLDKSNIMSFQRSLMNTIIHQNALEELAMVRVPTFVVFGRFDALIIQDEYSKENISNPLISFRKVKGAHVLDSHLSGELVKVVEELVATRANP